MPKPKVLFVCVENSCRSQMAEGLARRLWGQKVEVHSAGSRPSGKVDPGAVAAMRAQGIDISANASKGLDALGEVEWDCVVTMGCGDECPFLKAKRRVDWDLEDPKGKGPTAYLAAIKKIRSGLRKISSLPDTPAS